jgi:hypothetical protein
VDVLNATVVAGALAGIFVSLLVDNGENVTSSTVGNVKSVGDGAIVGVKRLGDAIGTVLLEDTTGVATGAAVVPVELGEATGAFVGVGVATGGGVVEFKSPILARHWDALKLPQIGVNALYDEPVKAADI